MHRPASSSLPWRWCRRDRSPRLAEHPTIRPPRAAGRARQQDLFVVPRFANCPPRICAFSPSMRRFPSQARQSMYPAWLSPIRTLRSPCARPSALARSARISPRIGRDRPCRLGGPAGHALLAELIAMAGNEQIATVPLPDLEPGKSENWVQTLPACIFDLTDHPRAVGSQGHGLGHRGPIWNAACPWTWITHWTVATDPRPQRPAGSRNWPRGRMASGRESPGRRPAGPRSKAANAASSARLSW